MSVYKIVDTEKLDKDLESIANTIRTKSGSTENFTFPEGFKSAIRNIPQEGVGNGSGSGIINVEELPTSGIDESAVYRLIEEVVVRPTNAFLVLFPGVKGGWLTLEEYLENQDIHPEALNVFDVKELPPNMEPSDVAGFTTLNFYINRADGKCYLYVAEYGMALSIGYLLGDLSMDKGSLDNLLDATEQGIYTTFEATEEFSRYFVRENYEWKEITAYVSITNQYQLDTLSLMTGDITSIVYSASDILLREHTEINKEWFRKRDGTYLDIIKPYMFYSSSLESAIIPDFISEIEMYAFARSYSLKVVTFKCVPKWLDMSTFADCDSLTTINVPWAEGEVAYSPWGAGANCTIKYNYTEG